MVDVKLLIEINPDSSSESIYSVTTRNRELANTSISANEDGVLDYVPTGVLSGSNGLSWGYKYENSDDNYLVFNNDDYLDNVENSNGYLESENDPTQIFWGVVPSSGFYNVRLTISGGTALKDIVIYGDKENNQFPIEAIINNSEIIYSDDPNWVINFGNTNNVQTIEITKWNRPNYNATIVAVAILGRYIEIKNQFIKDFESLSEIHEGDTISYKSIPNYGEFSIVDIDGEIRELVNSKTLTDSNIGIELYINNKLVRQHVTQSSDYDIFGNLFSVTATDLLEQMSDREIPALSYDGEVSLFDFVFSILNRFNYSYEDVAGAFGQSMFYNRDSVYGTIKSFMDKTTMRFPAISKMTVRNLIENLCEVLQLGARLNVNKKLEFFSLRPYAGSNKTIISIPLRNQYSVPSGNLFPVDVYKRVVMQGTTTEIADTSENYVGTTVFKVGDSSYYKKTSVEYIIGESGSNRVYESSSNVFMDNTIVFDKSNEDVSLVEIFGNNMLNDYANGTRYIKVKVSLNDYFDTYGNLVINSSNGDLFDVGDLVRIDKDNLGTSRFSNLDGSPVYWSVVGCNISRNGVPFIELSLREVKIKEVSNKVEKPYKTELAHDFYTEFRINTPTQGAKIALYTDDSYSVIQRIYNDGDVFFTTSTSLVSFTYYFKAVKDGMEDSEPFVFSYGTENGTGGGDLTPV